MKFDKFAAIADVHGNSDALAAVLADIDSLGIKTIVNLGDHASGPLAARETIDMLMSREMISIKGNHDRWLTEKPLSEMGASDRAARVQLSENHIDWLLSLPATASLSEGRVFLCHGTPNSDTTYWIETVNRSGEVVLRPKGEIEAEASSVDASLMLCGHTHIPRVIRMSDGRFLVNPGSVGCPGYDDDEPVHHVVQNGNPNASYAILEDRHLGWHVTIRSVPYNSARMVRLAEEGGRPEWARALSSGWVQY